MGRLFPPNRSIIPAELMTASYAIGGARGTPEAAKNRIRSVMWGAGGNSVGE